MQLATSLIRILTYFSTRLDSGQPCDLLSPKECRRTGVQLLSLSLETLVSFSWNPVLAMGWKSPATLVDCTERVLEIERS